MALSYPSEPPVAEHPLLRAPAPPRLWSWWGALLLVPAAFGVQVVVGVLAIIGLTILSAIGYEALAETWRWPLVTVSGSLGFLGLLLLTKLKPGTKPLWDSRDLKDWRNWVLAFGALIVSAGANLARIWLEKDPSVPDLNQQVLSMMESSPSTPWGPLLTLGLAVVILAPLTEEWFFRGLLLPALQRAFGGRWAWLGSWVAVPVSSVIFGLLHWPVWWVPGIYGAVIGLLSLRQRSLAMPMLVHFTINLTVFSMLLGAG